MSCRDWKIQLLVTGYTFIHNINWSCKYFKRVQHSILRQFLTKILTVAYKNLLKGLLVGYYNMKMYFSTTKFE